jgi:nucleoid DNA-binding protein
MTREEVIAALAADTDETNTRVQDFLQALTDLCADALEKGDTFPIADIGWFEMNPSISHGRNGLRAPIRFRIAEGFRERLKIKDEVLKAVGLAGRRVF